MIKVKKIILYSFVLATLVSCTTSQHTETPAVASKNSWSELKLENYQDIPPEWKYYTIPGTPLEIPLPTTSVIVTNRPKLEIFSLPEEESGFKNWDRDFGIELMEIQDWNASLEDYIVMLYDTEVKESDLIKKDGMYFNEGANTACSILLYKINNIDANERLTYCYPRRYEYTFLHENKIYRFGIWFDEHAGAQEWAHVALKNARIQKL